MSSKTFFEKSLELTDFASKWTKLHVKISQVDFKKTFLPKRLWA